jgi:hypothetical protein
MVNPSRTYAIHLSTSLDQFSLMRILADVCNLMQGAHVAILEVLKPKLLSIGLD